jgi:hypothetical protein
VKPNASIDGTDEQERRKLFAGGGGGAVAEYINEHNGVHVVPPFSAGLVHAWYPPNSLK